MNTPIVALAALLLTLPAPAAAQPAIDVHPNAIAYALEVACAAFPAGTCTNLGAPHVRPAPLSDAWGMFIREFPDTLWLDLEPAVGLSSGEGYNVFAMSILIHEMAHYIDHHDGTPLDASCEAEAVAWGTSNGWLVKAGQPQLGNWEWRKVYGC